MTARFRLIHVSDFHFGEISNVDGVFDVRTLNDWHAALRGKQRIDLQGTHCSVVALKLARMIFEEQETADAVLISGDLATTGLNGDLEAAEEYVFSKACPPYDYLNVSQNATLGCPDALPVLLMPGNHDRFHNHACAPGCRRFENYFGHIWNKNKNVNEYVLFDDQCDEHLVLLCADFSLRSITDASSILNFMGQGCVYSDILAELVSLTNDIRSVFPNAGISWVSHFFPAQSTKVVLEALSLRWSDNLIDAARKNNVKVIFCGHLHENVEIKNHDPMLFSAGSGCAYGERKFGGNWAHILEIEVARKQVLIIDRSNFQFQASHFVKV